MGGRDGCPEIAKTPSFRRVTKQTHRIPDLHQETLFTYHPIRWRVGLGMMFGVHNYVVVDGKLKRTEAFETGHLLAEDPEGFERARAKGLKRAKWVLYIYIPAVVASLVVILLFLDPVFILFLSIMWFTFIPQELLSIRTWRDLDHGKRVFDRGVETYLVTGWKGIRYFVPYNEIKEWKRSDQSVNIKTSRRLLTWTIDAEEVGEEGLELLVSILDGSYKTDVEPPKLVLYPS